MQTNLAGTSLETGDCKPVCPLACNDTQYTTAYKKRLEHAKRKCKQIWPVPRLKQEIASQCVHWLAMTRNTRQHIKSDWNTQKEIANKSGRYLIPKGRISEINESGRYLQWFDIFRQKDVEFFVAIDLLI